MAQVARIKTTGVKQGVFPGGSPRSGWTNFTEVHGFDYTVSNTFDQNRGTFTGKRAHEPILIRALLDSATPIYWNSLVSNEVVTSVQIDFFTNDKKGAEKNFYSITLTNAQIVSVRQYTHEDPTHDKSTDLREMVEYKIAFQKVDVTWTDGGKTASDDWLTPLTG
jgi:type VI secretion system secreted protein Hcp